MKTMKKRWKRKKKKVKSKTKTIEQKEKQGERYIPAANYSKST